MIVLIVQVVGLVSVSIVLLLSRLLTICDLVFDRSRKLDCRFFNQTNVFEQSCSDSVLTNNTLLAH